MDAREKAQLDSWITREDPSLAEWDNRVDKVIDVLEDVTDETLSIIESLLSGSLSPEALAVITAVVEGEFDKCYDGSYRVMEVHSLDDPCSKCGGSGKTPWYNRVVGREIQRERRPCSLCHGTGIAP